MEKNWQKNRLNNMEPCVHVAYPYNHHQVVLELNNLHDLDDMTWYDMILEKCKFKSYTVLWKNLFSTPNSTETDIVGKASPLWKSHLVLKYFFLFNYFFSQFVCCVYVVNSPVTPSQNGVANTNLLKSTQIVWNDIVPNMISLKTWVSFA